MAKTTAEKKIASIRRELAILVHNGKSPQDARKEINLKYGKGWREWGIVSNSGNQLGTTNNPLNPTL